MNVGDFLEAIKAKNPDSDLEVAIRIKDRCFSVSAVDLVVVDDSPFILAIDVEEQDQEDEDEDETAEETPEAGWDDGDDD